MKRAGPSADGLEDENPSADGLKHLVADLTLDNQALKTVLAKKF